MPRFRFAWLLYFVVLSACALVMFTDSAQAEEGLASWYGPGLEGNPTASGQPYDPNGFTAASKTLPLGTELIVSYQGRSVPVTVTDRGPYAGDRVLDLSYGAANALGLIPAGVGEVNYTIVPNGASSPTTTQDQPAQNQTSTAPPSQPTYAAPQPGYADGVGYGTGSPDYSQSYPAYSDPAITPTYPDSYTAAQPGAGGGTYVVQPGQTLSQIAAQLGTTVDQLASYNGIANPNLIYSGQTLYYPASGGVAPTGGGALAPGLAP